MPIIYIAGPFADPDPVFGVAANVASAARAARECMQKGWIFFCPHTHTQGFQHYPEFTEEQWYAFNLEHLKHCDALLLITGWSRSKGATMERQYAIEHNIPVFYENDGIPDAP
mgnify:FL=1